MTLMLSFGNLFDLSVSRGAPFGFLQPYDPTIDCVSEGHKIECPKKRT